MSNKYFGKRTLRKEDDRLLQGTARFADDIVLPDMLYVAFHRSPHAHARIVDIDVSRCCEVPGVVAAFTHADLGPAGIPFPQILPHQGLTSRTWRALAPGKVRFVGEAVVAVVADSALAARDALDEVDVTYDPLPAIVDLEEALTPDAPLVHEDTDSNIAVHYAQSFGDVETPLRTERHRLQERFRIRRGSGQPMEPRGVIASFDRHTGELTVWSSTQEPHTVRQTIASVLQVRPTLIRVITPDTGGGFGTKLNVYPEEVLIPWIARSLERPVKWIETRSEHMLSATHEREQIHDVEVAFDDQGRIKALKSVFLHDSGAYTPRGGAAPLITSSSMPGPYQLPNYSSEFRSVYTTTSTVSVYRGAGQPQAVFVMERIMDRIARALGMDPAEVRLKNMIPAEAFPYDTNMKSFIGTPIVYDSGDFQTMLKKTLDAADYKSLREEQDAARTQGRLLGIGVVSYVELTGRGPWEGGAIRVEPDGIVSVHTGAPNQGQGHATTLAQICADELGVPMDSVNVTTGDTAMIPHGIGTSASRVGVLAGNAVRQAAIKVKRRILKAAGEMLEIPTTDLSIANGIIRSTSNSEASLPLVDIAGWSARRILPGEDTPGLEAIEYFQVSQMTYASGAHLAVVEIDKETGAVDVVKYVIGHDCGRIINPLVVEGQIRGGLACGLGNALLEQHVYDDTGQLLTGSFMDYAMPRAANMPPLTIVHQENPSTLNPLGVKGTGEAGTIPVAATICSAVEDALAPLQITLSQSPILPQDIWSVISETLAENNQEASVTEADLETH